MNGRDTSDASGSDRPQIGALEPGRVLSGIILLIGVAVLSWGTYAYVQDTAVLNERVEVTAEVTSTSVKGVDALRGGEQYVPMATFEYSFRGMDHSSNNLFPGSSPPRYQDRAAAESRLAPFPVGEAVTAYVDPAAPGEAFLVDGRSGQATRYLAFGAFLALIGGLRQLQLWAQPRDSLPLT